MNISSHIEVFIGMTSKQNLKRRFKDFKTEEAFKVSKILVHPLLSTNKQVYFISDYYIIDLKLMHYKRKMFQFSKTPDLALIKLQRKINFSKVIRPICLSRNNVKEKPICEDNSFNRS